MAENHNNKIAEIIPGFPPLSSQIALSGFCSTLARRPMTEGRTDGGAVLPQPTRETRS